MDEKHFVGVDVGTRSARAGIFDTTGKLLGSAKHDIALFLEPGDIAEQSSNDIWRAVAASVREALRLSGVPAASVAGVGFDATCSLVVLGEGGVPLPVGHSSDKERNIIVWMDHRAVRETDRINALGHRVLDYVGGTISPEMQTPKLLWLRENLPQTFAQAWQFFDLADYLTWRSTGSLVRSMCTLTCKWTYLGHERRWAPDYLHAIGLGDLAEEGFSRIGTEVAEPGTALGAGLSPEAAADFGLPAGISVASGLIDAHAGGVGTVGAKGGTGTTLSRMAYVFGTSACTMASTEQPAYVKGVWGPYHSAMVPGLWLLEGGQSAAGAAIDHLVQFHPAAPAAKAQAQEENTPLVEWLARRAQEGLSDLSASVERIGSVQVVPEFLGNRSPFADPSARALIAGLGMQADIGSLVGLYLAGVCSLGYGVGQIIAAMRDKGVAVDTIIVSGGAAQSPLVRQLLADASRTTVAAPRSPEPVLLGSAMLGASAAGAFPDLRTAMTAMSEIEDIYHPSPAYAAWHEARARSFALLQKAARDTR